MKACVVASRFFFAMGKLGFAMGKRVSEGCDRCGEFANSRAKNQIGHLNEKSNAQKTEIEVRQAEIERLKREGP